MEHRSNLAGEKVLRFMRLRFYSSPSAAFPRTPAWPLLRRKRRSLEARQCRATSVGGRTQASRGSPSPGRKRYTRTHSAICTRRHPQLQPPEDFVLYCLRHTVLTGLGSRYNAMFLLMGGVECGDRRFRRRRLGSGKQLIPELTLAIPNRP